MIPQIRTDVFLFRLREWPLLKAVFTLYRKVFAPARKPYREGLVFKYGNGDFGAISVTERSCAPIMIHISDTSCSYCTG